MNKYSIQPVNIVVNGTTYVATDITMDVLYPLNATEMTVPYMLLGADGRLYWADNVLITETELDAWGTDNMYIVNLVATKVGVTLV